MHIFDRVFLFTPLLQTVNETFLDNCELSLSEPIRYLRKSLCLEVGFEGPGVLLLRREKGKEVFDATFLERASKMIHGLVKQICAENDRNDAQGDV